MSEFVFMTTKYGKAIKFAHTEVRPMGRQSKGVRGINLKPKDAIVDMLTLMDAPQIFVMTVSSLGFGKRTPITDYPARSRGGMGIISFNVSKKTGLVVATVACTEHSQIMFMTAKGKTILLPASEIRVSGRATSGVKVIALEPGDRVTAASRLIPQPS